MKSKKILLAIIVLAVFTFGINGIYNMNKEQKNHEVKAQVTESLRLVDNAAQFQQALNERDSDIRVRTQFDSSSTFYINYNVTISPDSALNSIFYNGASGGSLFVIQPGGSLTVSSLVLGTSSYGSKVITIQNGGSLTFRRTSIIDCSTADNDIGILIENGGAAYMYSSWILKASTGIYVKNGASLSFPGPDESGRTNTISSGGNGIYYENITGNVYLNSGNLRVGRNNSENGGNTNGVVFTGSGALHVSAGNYYENTNGIVANSGTVNISGGSIYSNGTGVVVQGATVNQTGGSIYSNTDGVNINNNGNSKFIKTNGNISGNSRYSINHGNVNDGSCRVTGGTTSGYIYLAQNDNYVNSYSSYPGLAVQPSTYWLGRKLVKTDSNAVAKNEFGNVTMAPNGNWYKYIQDNDQYIVVWTGGNIYVNHINKYTNSVLAKDHLNGNIGDSWTSSSKVIDGYKLFSTPTPSSGTYTSNADITINYEYVKVSNVVAKYIDENYNTELMSETKAWGQGETYTTEKKTIDEYAYTRDSGNTTATMGDSDVEVKYYYKKISEGVDVRYIDQVKKTEIKTTAHIDGLELDPYTTKAPVIDGYVLVSSKDTITGNMTVAKTTITFEYRKLSDVTARYTDANYNTKIRDDIVTTYKEGDFYTTDLLEFEGYAYMNDYLVREGYLGDHDILVEYKYKKISEGVEAKYIDQVTKEEIADPVVIPGVEKNPYATYAKDIDGYELVLTPDNTKGELAVEKITVTYEYRKNSNVTVNHIDEITGLTLVQQQKTKYKQDDPYTTSQADIEGYTCTRVEGQANGTVVRDNITVTYYYKKDTSVTVKYVDMLDNNKEISEKVVIPGQQNDDYTTTKKDIPGYIFVETSGIVNGKMKYNPSEVIYKYKKASNVITRHIDANTGNPIVDDVVRVCKQGEKFEAYPQNLEGYIVVEEPDEKTGVMGRDDITKVFKYKKLSKGLVVKYVDILAGDILDQVTYDGNENDSISLEEKTFLGYVLYQRPESDTILLGVEPDEVVYYYKKEIENNLIGIDQETGEQIYEDIVSGIEGEPYTTIPRIVEGYEVVRTPENNNGTFTRDSINIIYEYRKTARDVIVRYMNAETGEEMESYRISGKEGDSYQAQRKEFENYELVEVVGQEVGVLSTEEKEVKYYYERITGKVSIVYEDEEGNVLLTEGTSGKVGDKYEVTIKEIEGYKIVEVIGETTGNYDKTTKEIRVRMEKVQEKPAEKGKIIVRFVDENGNTIREDYVEYGEKGDKFNYELPKIDGYKVVGNSTVKAKFIDGELVFEAKYEKIQNNVEVVDKDKEQDKEPVETGDMNVVMLVVISLVSLIGLKKLAKKYSL